MKNHRDDTVSAADGHKIAIQAWASDGEPVAVVQILHGLGEHIGRYARFAAAANERGFAVIGHDHRGHGPGCSDRGYFSGRDGWRKVVADVHAVNEWCRDRYAGLPIVMLGHSMGSFIAESFAMHHGAYLKGLLLSGSNWPARLQLLPGRIAAYLEAWRIGPQNESRLLARLGFGAFNKCFKPNRTDFDWLSRDEAEVDKYIADPACGGPFSCRLWTDFLGGLWELGSDDALNRIPADLPILISGGGADPVGGEKGMASLMMHYAQTGHSRVKLRIYPDGRHEMLNEINRDDVTRDWLDWIATTVGLRQAERPAA
ncbi:MAG TPA: alpha/beta hydrolase [Woeseiaceae bacterium]|jgi:alpha-beta hydrolase superfamily lysophospholipase|nr:alpha/beta hydrolase [Woeseiaceae bacterium]